MFKSWGVLAVNIKGTVNEKPHSTAEAADISPVIMQLAEEEVRRQFQHVELSHPLMAELFKIRIREHGKWLMQQRAR